MMNFRNCYSIATDIVGPQDKRYRLKRLSFALRLWLSRPSLTTEIEAFFAKTSLRKSIFMLPNFRTRIYKQQVRKSFYHGSHSHDRLHFLKSHYQFLEQTHNSETILNLHTQQQPAFMFEQADSVLSFDIEYTHGIASEGFLAFNLRLDQNLLCKITFWFTEYNGKTCLCIGALQGGINTLDANKKFTKEFFGLRPQNMALAALRRYAKTLGVTQLLAMKKEKLWARNIADQTLIDALWEEQGAQAVENTPFIKISAETPRKELSEIATRKRSMYRKRYEFLDTIENQLDHYFADGFLIAQPSVNFTQLLESAAGIDFKAESNSAINKDAIAARLSSQLTQQDQPPIQENFSQTSSAA